MPCEFCVRNNIHPENPFFAQSHTLSRCREITPQVEFHHQRNVEQAQYPSLQYQPTYTIDMLRTPLLKRLAKRLGCSMNQNIPRLRQYCLGYYQSIRRAFLLSFQQNYAVSTVIEPTQSVPQVQETATAISERVRRVLDNIANVRERTPTLPNTNENTPVASTFLNSMGIYRPSYLSSNQQGNHTVAIGSHSGSSVQGNHAIAISSHAGQNFQQGNYAIAISSHAGQNFQQGNHAVALGWNAGSSVQGNYAVAIGGGQQPPQPKVVLRFKEPELKQESIIDLTDEDNGSKITTCCICLETNTYIKTNCGHVFCNCILQHLSKNGVSCPMCRGKVFELNYGDAEHLDTTVKMLPMLPVPLQRLFCSDT